MDYKAREIGHLDLDRRLACNENACINNMPRLWTNGTLKSQCIMAKWWVRKISENFDFTRILNVNNVSNGPNIPKVL